MRLLSLPLTLLVPPQRGACFARVHATGAAALRNRLRWEMADVVRELVWQAGLAEGHLRQAEAVLASAASLRATVAKRQAAPASWRSWICCWPAGRRCRDG